MLAEYMLIACFFRELVSSAIMKMSIGLFLFCFPFFWAGTTVSGFGVSNWNSYVTMACNPCLPFFCIPAAAFVSGLGGWNSYVVMAGDLFCVCVSARYLYELFTAGDLVDFGRCPEFWISVGVFFYSCCELPITGMLNFWARNFVPVAIQLYSILQVLNIIMYSIFIYAFLCPLKTGTTK